MPTSVASLPAEFFYVCSIHACGITFSFPVSKPAQVEDCATDLSAYLHSVAGNSTVVASTAVLETVVT